MTTLRKKEPDNDALLALLRELEFPSLLKYVTRQPEQWTRNTCVLEEKEFEDVLALLASASGSSVSTPRRPLSPPQGRSRRHLLFDQTA